MVKIINKPLAVENLLTIIILLFGELNSEISSPSMASNPMIVIMAFLKFKISNKGIKHLILL
jgi:hypothetical protein